MKKLMLILLLFPALAWAGPGYMVFDSNAVPVVAGCSTPTGDVIYESFGDDSTACTAGGTEACVNTWTISGDSQTFKSELPGSPPEGSCTYGLLSDTANESTERIYLDIGDAIAYTTSVDVELSLYVDSATTIDNNATMIFVSFGANNAGNYNFAWSLQLLDSSEIQPIIRANGASVATGTTLTENTWYTIFVHSDATAADSYYTVNGGAHQTFTRYDKNMEYLVVGSVSGEGATEALKFYVGYVYVNTP